MPGNHDPGPLLASLIEGVPGTRSAVLLSAEGLAVADAGLGRDAADQLAAITSGLFSLARTAARSGEAPGVRQVLIDTDDLLLFTAAAGRAAVVAVLAGRETDTGTLGSALARLAQDLAPFLSTQLHVRGAGVIKPEYLDPSPEPLGSCVRPWRDH